MDLVKLAEFAMKRQEFYTKFDSEIQALGLTERVSSRRLEFGRLGATMLGIWHGTVLKGDPPEARMHSLILEAGEMPYSDEVLAKLVGSFAKAAGYNTDLHDLAVLASEGNRIKLDGFSNPESERLYKEQWPDDPALKEQYENGGQCGGCSFFAPLDSDWGLCLYKKSKHFRETVFEHFSCPTFVSGGWGAHSFNEDTYMEDK